VIAALAAVALVLLAAGLYFARVETEASGSDNGFARDDWFVVGGAVWVALVLGLAALRTVRYAPAGIAAAAHWLGVKRFLGAQDGFGDAPAASVAIWDRLLAYGAAIGTARGALDDLPLEVEDPGVAWSREGGAWRQVRIEYPTRFGYGEPPIRVLGTGILKLGFFGAIAFVVLPVVVDFLWTVATDVLDGGDLGDGPLLGLLIGFTVVFGGVALALLARVVDAAIRVYRGVRDLNATETVTGRVVKRHDASEHSWFAVDPGEVEELAAYYWTDGATPARGAVVNVVLTPRLRHVISVERRDG
jgi:hypothetical protein